MAEDINPEIAVGVSNVSKVFKLPHEKQGSIKSKFVSMLRPNSGYDTQQALKDVSFDIKKGEFFGIVGRNGSGKSTLLKIIAGIYQPTEGTVGVKGKLVPFIELGVGFNPELTGRENVYLNGALLGFSNTEVKNMYKDIVDFAELKRFMDQKLKNYSSGMQVRLAFSMAIRAKADVLLIDEVLAVGDADFQRKCFEYFKTLKKNRQTVVFVSHDMSAIREFCDRALLIDESKVMDIGKTSEIANKYSQLFIDKDSDSNGEPIIESKDGKRWGNGKIAMRDVKIRIVGDELIVSAQADVKEELDGVMYGLHIASQDGSEITAMNNRMINERDLKDLHKGSSVSITWKMLNIFNDGKYFITLTLVDEAGIAFDWYGDAAAFTVKRSKRSTTAVLPPVSVKYKIVGTNE